MFVTQMYKGSVSQKQFMPLFMVSMPKINNADDLFNLDELMGTLVVVEPYKGKKAGLASFWQWTVLSGFKNGFNRHVKNPFLT